MKLLNDNEELQEIVSLVGAEALTADQQLTLRMARSMIEDFLMQNAFSDVDSYCSSEKQYIMLCMILDFYRGARERLHKGEDLQTILQSEHLEFFGKARYIPQEEIETIRQTWIRIQEDWLVE